MIIQSKYAKILRQSWTTHALIQHISPGSFLFHILTKKTSQMQEWASVGLLWNTEVVIEKIGFSLSCRENSCLGAGMPYEGFLFSIKIIHNNEMQGHFEAGNLLRLLDIPLWPTDAPIVSTMLIRLTSLPVWTKRPASQVTVCLVRLIAAGNGPLL